MFLSITLKHDLYEEKLKSPQIWYCASTAACFGGCAMWLVLTYWRFGLHRSLAILPMCTRMSQLGSLVSEQESQLSLTFGIIGLGSQITLHL